MINSVQLLRAFAAIYVVIFHAAKKLDIANNFTTAGASGVDLFFIISGFVITHTFLRNTGIKPRTFITRRVIRIVPLYWTLTTIFALLLYFIPSIFETHKFSIQHTVVSFLFIPEVIMPVVNAGWTLNYEMYFYILFSVSLFFFGREAPKYLLIVFIFSTLMGVVNDSLSPVGALMTSELLIEFGIGITFCYLYNSGFRLSKLQSIFCVVLGISLFFVLSERTRIYSYGIPWAVVFIGLVFRVHRILENRLFIFLGDTSYSIYLVHVITIPAIHFLVKYVNINTSHNTEILLLGYIAIGIISGIICYILLERPLTNTIRSLVFKSLEPQRGLSRDVPHF